MNTNLPILLTAYAFLTSACAVPPPQPDNVVRAPDYASTEPDLTSPEGTAYAMMMAMYRGDADLVDQVFHPEGDLHRVKEDGLIQFGGRARWQAWVGTLEPGYANEELFDIKVEEFANLATVWAPFVISVDGKLVGCGVNQLSMVKSQGEWRIVSGMDVQASKDECADFKTNYRAGKGK